MHKLYQTFGSGDLKSSANKAFDMTKDGPVVILSRTQPRAVLVSPDEWNATAALIEDLRERLGRERRLRISNQRHFEMVNDPSHEVSQEEFDKILADMGLDE